MLHVTSYISFKNLTIGALFLAVSFLAVPQLSFAQSNTEANQPLIEMLKSQLAIVQAQISALRANTPRTSAPGTAFSVGSLQRNAPSDCQNGILFYAEGVKVPVVMRTDGVAGMANGNMFICRSGSWATATAADSNVAEMAARGTTWIEPYVTYPNNRASFVVHTKYENAKSNCVDADYRTPGKSNIYPDIITKIAVEGESKVREMRSFKCQKDVTFQLDIPRLAPGATKRVTVTDPQGEKTVHTITATADTPVTNNLDQIIQSTVIPHTLVNGVLKGDTLIFDIALSSKDPSKKPDYEIVGTTIDWGHEYLNRSPRVNLGRMFNNPYNSAIGEYFSTNRTLIRRYREFGVYTVKVSHDVEVNGVTKTIDAGSMVFRVGPGPSPLPATGTGTGSGFGSGSESGDGGGAGTGTGTGSGSGAGVGAGNTDKSDADTRSGLSNSNMNF